MPSKCYLEKVISIYSIYQLHNLHKPHSRAEANECPYPVTEDTFTQNKTKRTRVASRQERGDEI